MGALGYRVAVRPEGRDEVVVKVEPRELRFRKHYEIGVEAEVVYSSASLARFDQDAHLAVLALWPMADALVLYRRDEVDGQGEDDGWVEAFVGAVTELNDVDGQVTVVGHMLEMAKA